MIGLFIRFGLPVLIVLGVIAGLIGFGYSTGSASTQRKWDAATAIQVQAQLAATEQARATEQALQAKVSEASHARERDRIKNNRIAADLRAGADRLRSDIAAFAGGGPNDPAAACSERAATLGSVLDGVLSDARTCAAGAETVADDLRAMIAAWPVQPK